MANHPISEDEFRYFLERIAELESRVQMLENWSKLAAQKLGIPRPI